MKTYVSAYSLALVFSNFGNYGNCGTFGNLPLERLQILNHLRISPVPWSNIFAPYFPGSINDVGFRLAGGGIKLLALLLSIAHRKQINVMVLEELVIGMIINVPAYRKHCEFLSHALLQLN